jgi:hypothetical protein
MRQDLLIDRRATVCRLGPDRKHSERHRDTCFTICKDDKSLPHKPRFSLKGRPNQSVYNRLLGYFGTDICDVTPEDNTEIFLALGVLARSVFLYRPEAISFRETTTRPEP